MQQRRTIKTRMFWQIAAALLLTAVGIAISYDAWADMLHIGAVDEESSHMFLVPPVCAWLVWVRRSRLRYCQFRCSYIGPAIIATGWLISSMGFRHAVQSFWHAGAVLIAAGCIVTVLGRDLLVRFLPAFFALLFLVPIPGRFRQAVSVPLMTTTAQVTQNVSEILGIPVERSGNTLSINGNKVGIIEACNGLRMVFALVLVSYAFAFGEPLHNYVRALILIASPLSAIICNVIRLVPTLWLHGYGERLAAFLRLTPKPGQTVKEIGEVLAKDFHDMAGWAMLVIGFLMLTGIIRILRWAMIPVTPYTLAAAEL